ILTHQVPTRDTFFAGHLRQLFAGVTPQFLVGHTKQLPGALSTNRALFCMGRLPCGLSRLPDFHTWENWFSDPARPALRKGLCRREAIGRKIWRSRKMPLLSVGAWQTKKGNPLRSEKIA